MLKKPTFITALLLVLTYSTSIAAQKIHISTGFTPPVSNFYQSILAELNKRMPGIEISFDALPAERSLLLVDQGINDGDCCRIPDIVLDEYKNLVKVDPSFFSARFSVFSKDHRKTIHKFEDLKPYTVGSVEGWKIAVRNIKRIKPAETYIVTTPEQLFRMLDQDRIDYAVIGYLSGLDTISKLGLKNIHVIEPPLVEKELFLLLNKKHRKLIPQIRDTLIKMKNDGTVNMLYADMIKVIK